MKNWFFLLGAVLIIIGLAFSIRSQVLQKRQTSGLQVNAEPRATVFLGGKHLGQTPLEDKNLKPGEYLLKLVPEEPELVPWERKIKLMPGILTIVDQKLAEMEEYTSGQVLSLEPLTNKKLVALAIISNPSEALVKIDGATRGFSPISIEDIAAGDHTITLSLPGYLEKQVKAKTIEGKKLIIDVTLAKKKAEEKEATASAEEEGKSKTPYVEIKDTPTGWLRVRMEPSTTATEAARVNPGEKYPLLDEEKGWYKIRYQDNKEGWISGRYATKYE